MKIATQRTKRRFTGPFILFDEIGGDTRKVCIEAPQQ
jgi:hypothetical protein